MWQMPVSALSAPAPALWPVLWQPALLQGAFNKVMHCWLDCIQQKVHANNADCIMHLQTAAGERYVCTTTHVHHASGNR